jgi:hypothetical protein
LSGGIEGKIATLNNVNTKIYYCAAKKTNPTKPGYRRKICKICDDISLSIRKSGAFSDGGSGFFLGGEVAGIKT